MRRGLVKSLKRYLQLIYTGASWRRKLLVEIIMAPKVFWAYFQYRTFLEYFCTFRNLKRESVRVVCPETLKAHSPEAAILWNNGTHSARRLIFIYELKYRFLLDKPFNDKTTVWEIPSGAIKRCFFSFLRCPKVQGALFKQMFQQPLKSNQREAIAAWHVTPLPPLTGDCDQ